MRSRASNRAPLRRWRELVVCNPIGEPFQPATFLGDVERLSCRARLRWHHVPRPPPRRRDAPASRWGLRHGGDADDGHAGTRILSRYQDVVSDCNGTRRPVWISCSAESKGGSPPCRIRSRPAQALPRLSPSPRGGRACPDEICEASSSIVSAPGLPGSGSR